MIFENNVSQHVATEEGRARLESGIWKFDYFLKDHLGNVRIMLADNGTVLEETHYYPFGLVQRGKLDEVAREIVVTMEEVVVNAALKAPKGMGFFERVIFGTITFLDRVFSGSDGEGATSSSASDAKGDYSHLEEPKNVGDGKKTTPAQRKRILEENRKQNDGDLISDGDGRRLKPPKANKKGEKADMDQAEIDHVKPRSKGGSNSNSNQRVVSKEENLKKGNRE